MKRACIVIMIMALIGCLGCNTENENHSQNTPARFRDLKGFFSAEIIRLQQSGLQLHKTARLGSEEDSMIILKQDSATLQDLLKPFIDADINKPSLWDAYDTVHLTDQFKGSQSVVYTAKDPQVNPRQIMLDLDKTGQIQTVNIHSYSRNLIYESRQDLFYQYNKTINITTFQKIAFLAPKEMDVKVRLEPKNPL
ncbi:hypothetical protein [Chitinophaga defluvii]|uniref:Lipoprotein n=1 Tax=Chitinophaga defluvii TaxID=3163343 RepID=A0ABV2T996_9BACT